METNTEKHRLFVAIDVPEAAADAFTGLRKEVRGFRWIDPHQLHLTLLFLGDTPTDQLERLRHDLSSVASSPIDLFTENLGVFPSKRNPRVLVVRVRHSEALDTLQRQVSETAERAGFTLESRPFKSHITIARLRNVKAPELNRYLADVDAEPFRLTIGSFHLYESHLSPLGAKHQRLASYPLTASDQWNSG